MAKERKGRKDYAASGSYSAHVIKVDCGSNTVKHWNTLEEFKTQKEIPVDEENNPSNEDLQEFETIEDGIGVIGNTAWNAPLEASELFSLNEDTFVAIRSSPESLAIFHLMKISEKGIATENMIDGSKEHCVLKGDCYLIGKRFSFVKETRKFAAFKEAKGTVDALIHVGEVFSTNVSLNDDHQMDIYDIRLFCFGKF